MKILTAAQTHQLDQATMQEQHLLSPELMERAATAFVQWFTGRFTPAEAGEILLLCGPGNNGGDGLAAARLLQHAGYRSRVPCCPPRSSRPTGSTTVSGCPPRCPWSKSPRPTCRKSQLMQW